MMELRRLPAAWHAFFFRPQPVVGLAVFRIAFGALLVATLAILMLDWKAWYGSEALLSPEGAAWILPGPRLNLFRLLPPGDGWVLALLLACGAAAIGVTIGCFTRLSALVVFVGLVSLHHRNPLILNAGDTLLRVLTFLLIFSPAGRALGVDRWWRVGRGRAPDGMPMAAPWAQRLMQIQVSVVYLSTFLWKTRGEMWVDGTALYYVSRLSEFNRFPVPFVFDDLWLIRAATWGSLLVEFSLGVLVWVRELRYPILAVGVLFHLGIEYALNIPLFQWIAIAALLTFVEPADAQAFFDRLMARRRAGSQSARLAAGSGSLAGSETERDPAGSRSGD